MDNHVENLSALRQLALDIRDISKQKEDLNEQYLHIKQLSNVISCDMKRFINWNALDAHFEKSTSYSAKDFYNDLISTVSILEKIDQIEPQIRKLCECVGTTDLDDAKFMYTLFHDNNNIITQLATASKLLSNFKENVIAVEKVYYKTFYSMRVIRKLPKPDTSSSFNFWTIIKSCIYPAVGFLCIFLFLSLIGAGVAPFAEFVVALPLPVIIFGGIASFISFILDMGTTVWIFLLLILYAPLHYTILLPFFKIYFVNKGKKMSQSIDAHPVSDIKSNFPSLLKQTADLLEKTNYDSNITYCSTLEDIGSFLLWHSKTLEEAAQRHIDAVKFGKEFAASLRNATRIPSSENSYYSSSAPRSSEITHSTSYNPYEVHATLEKRVGETLREKHYATVAIFYSPTYSQWYRLNKYGQTDTVSVDRSYPHHFVAHDGTQYKVTEWPNTQSTYFY